MLVEALSECTISFVHALSEILKSIAWCHHGVIYTLIQPNKACPLIEFSIRILFTSVFNFLLPFPAGVYGLICCLKNTTISIPRHPLIITSNLILNRFEDIMKS